MSDRRSYDNVSELPEAVTSHVTNNANAAETEAMVLARHNIEKFNGELFVRQGEGRSSTARRQARKRERDEAVGIKSVTIRTPVSQVERLKKLGKQLLQSQPGSITVVAVPTRLADAVRRLVKARAKMPKVALVEVWHDLLDEEERRQ